MYLFLNIKNVFLIIFFFFCPQIFFFSFGPFFFPLRQSLFLSLLIHCFHSPLFLSLLITSISPLLLPSLSLLLTPHMFSHLSIIHGHTHLHCPIRVNFRSQRWHLLPQPTLPLVYSLIWRRKREKNFENIDSRVYGFVLCVWIWDLVQFVVW